MLASEPIVTDVADVVALSVEPSYTWYPDAPVAALHARLIDDAVVAVVRRVGAAGRATIVVAVTALLAADSPTELYALT